METRRGTAAEIHETPVLLSGNCTFTADDRSISAHIRTPQRVEYADILWRLTRGPEELGLSQLPVITIRGAGGTPVARLRPPLDTVTSWLNRNHVVRRAVGFGTGLGMSLDRPQSSTPDESRIVAVPRSPSATPDSCTRALELESSTPYELQCPDYAPTPTEARRCVLLLPPGSYDVYVGATLGSTHLVCVGQLTTDDPRTLLQRRVIGVHGRHAPWFRAVWDDGHFALAPTAQPDSPESDATLLLAELAAATRTGAVTLESGQIAGARLEVSAAGARLPDDIVEAWMSEWYGPTGQELAPSSHEWAQILDATQLCLAAPYDVALGPTSDPLRICVALSSLVEATPVARFSARIRAAELLITATGPRRLTQRSMPTVHSDLDARGDALYPRVALVGDALAFSGRTTDLSLCEGGRCRHLGAGSHRFRQQGVYEVRMAGPSRMAQLQNRTLLRIVVLDVWSRLHPEGLTVGSRAPGDAGWPAARHDGSTFLFNHRQDDVAFTWDGLGEAAVVWNRSHGAPLSSRRGTLADLVPGTDLRDREGVLRLDAQRSALVVLASTDDQCPEVASYRPQRLDDLVVDRHFTLFVAHHVEDSNEFDCLARMRFQVSERRLLAQEGPLRLTVLGDPRLAIHPLDGIAVTTHLPAIAATLLLPAGFVVEGSIVGSAGVSLAGDFSRTGVALSAELQWGIPEVLPRMLSVGVLLRLFYSDQGPQTPLSPYLAVNLGTLIDLVGGR